MIQRIVYFSRNRMTATGSELTAEVEQILATARVNNAALGVTGALIFNSGGFAQALEGDVEAVGAVFEKIQRDPRHSDVLVLECAFVPERLFSHWSMAYAGANRQHERMFGAISQVSGFDHEHLTSTEVFQAMQRLVREEEVAA